MGGVVTQERPRSGGMTQLFLLHPNKRKVTAGGWFGWKPSWGSHRPLSFPSSPCLAPHSVRCHIHIRSSNPRLRVGRDKGYFQRKDWNLGGAGARTFTTPHPPTANVMPFVSVELINFLLAKLTPHSPFSSCGFETAGFWIVGKPESAELSRCTSRVFAHTLLPFLK